MFLLDHATYCPPPETRHTIAEDTATWKHWKGPRSCETENLKILVDVAKISGIRSKCAPLNLVKTAQRPARYPPMTPPQVSALLSRPLMQRAGPAWWLWYSRCWINQVSGHHAFEE
eukprot:GHUV01017725.1.p1 GENE.GHUV01017725.1~~GHUV01017725.1.p1  ORF type:complete len:116 (+),score=2.55 GHUV01017725.1:239-586(+)